MDFFKNMDSEDKLMAVMWAVAGVVMIAFIIGATITGKGW